MVEVGGIAIPLPPDAGKPEVVKPVEPERRPRADLPAVPPAEPPVSTARPAGPFVTKPKVPGTAGIYAPVYQETPAPPLDLPPIMPAPPPAPLPLPPPFPAGPGSIEVGGVPMPYEALTQMMEGQLGGSGGGCSACGGDGCAPAGPAPPASRSASRSRPRQCSAGPSA